MGFLAATVERTSAGHNPVGHDPVQPKTTPTKRPLKHWSTLLGALLILGFPQSAWAQTALTWARVELLRNRVQLIPNGRSARAAQITDILGIGDALRTARASRAELRFNDGSLARIGERATFRFTPNTRNFQLSNGTVLLLIPPGRGRTTIQTPNAVTGIQGSALFVRFIQETDTTIIGALTNNARGPMVAYTASGSQEQPLYAGQMVVIEGDRITRMFDFDIAEFYRTSGLMEDLDAESVEGVYEEMMDALEQQQELEGEDLQENPSFITPPVIGTDPTFPGQSTDLAAVPAFENSPADRFHQVVTARQRPSSRYSQATADTAPPVASVNATGQAHQVTATRQQPNGSGVVATTVATGTVATGGAVSAVAWE
ncbi:MAG: FecR family protein [Cyanobacteria bacterium J06632_22]